MATAEKIQALVPQPPVKKERVMLTLSINEAETLLLILGKVGGIPATTRRRYADSISKALSKAGMTHQSISAEYGANSASDFFDNRSGIYFTDEFHVHVAKD